LPICIITLFQSTLRRAVCPWLRSKIFRHAMLILPGSNALSAFRTQRLLTQLQAVDSAIAGVSARYLHLIDASAPLADADQRRLDGMLTYGDPFKGSEDGESFVVIPRLGTISPWASKATDIAHNCGLT